MSTIGIADTMFARGDMGSLAEATIKKNSDHKIIRYTVPGVKDLTIACKKLFEEHNCDIIIACGYVGAEPVDKVCGHEASTGIQQVQLSAGKHILEIFVHEDEGNDTELAEIMKNRVTKHSLNALELLKGMDSLRSKAGIGERQGRENAIQLDLENPPAKKTKLGIIVAEFNRELTFGMRDTAKAYAESKGCVVSKVLEVPGVFDMPLAIKQLCKDREVDAIVLIGAVIRGETKHDSVIATSTVNIAAQLSVQFNKPIACGIIGPGSNWKQAEERSNEYAKRAVDAAVRMINI